MLPFELVDLILQNVEDKRTLGRCGLVCKIWLQLTRPALFSKILLRMGNAHRLAVLLRKPQKTTFTKLVHTIVFAHSDTALIRHPWTRHTLPSLLQCLPHLTTLRLTSLDTSYAIHLSPVFSMISRLELCLTDPAPAPYAAVAWMICSLPMLEDVHLTSAAADNSRTPVFAIKPRRKLPPLVHLRTVHIEYAPLAAPLLKYIMLADPPPPLAALSFIPGEGDNIHQCLRWAGTALAILTIAFPDGAAFAFPAPPDPTPLLRVKTLRLRISTSSPRELCHGAVQFLTGTHFSTPTLEELVLESTTDDDGDVGPTTREELMPEVSSLARAVPSLRVVRVCVVGATLHFPLYDSRPYSCKDPNSLFL
ncbi:hypothetical protein C8R43DRAFT_991187 [Mycena crocata]|nr:hypothetical protein C8R43DRAFT_991187 [Mycena crocata]